MRSKPLADALRREIEPPADSGFPAVDLDDGAVIRTYVHCRGDHYHRTMHPGKLADVIADTTNAGEFMSRVTGAPYVRPMAVTGETTHTTTDKEPGFIRRVLNSVRFAG